MAKIDVSGWPEQAERLKTIYNGPTMQCLGFRQGVDFASYWINEKAKESVTNRDWLDSLSPVELVDWIKNTAAGMADAELLKWMEEKHDEH